MKEVGQMGSHVQRVVERQHQHVTRQDGDVIPHEVLLQCRCGGQAGLIDDLAHSTDDLEKEGVASKCYSIEDQRFRTTFKPLNDQPLNISNFNIYILLLYLPQPQCNKRKP